MVLSYQLLSCPRKKRGARRVPRNGTALANAPSTFTRSFQTFLQSFRKKNPNTVPTPYTFSEKERAPNTSGSVRKAVRSFYLSATKRGDQASPLSDPNQQMSEKTRPTLRERRALRSLYLNTSPASPQQKRYPGPPSPLSPSRHIRRLGRVFQLGETPPETPPGYGLGSPPHTPPRRRNYQQLDDDALYYSSWSNEEAYNTEPATRPADARISPWSPNEEQFPYPRGFLSPITEVHTPRSPISPYTPSTPQTPTSAGSNVGAWFLVRTPGAQTPLPFPRGPPPMYPPPPPPTAYLPDVPLRGPGSVPSTPTRPRTYSSASASLPSTPARMLDATANSTSTLTLVPDPPVSPIVASLRQAIDGELGSWAERPPLSAVGVRPGPGSSSDAGVFVIANDSESEEGDLESVSMYTDESIEPLKV